MGNHNIFNYVNVYHVDAVCQTPFHTGSGKGEAGEILTHPVTGVPFIQASGIAGPFRNYSEKRWGEDICKSWFGASLSEGPTADKDDFRSRLVFTDAVFDEETLQIELRSRVNINKETGTTDSRNVSGVKSGQLLQTEYVSSGSTFSFDIYEYYKEADELHIIEECLAALDSGQILIGGQLSNGCGSISLKDVKKSAVIC